MKRIEYNRARIISRTLLYINNKCTKEYPNNVVFMFAKARYADVKALATRLEPVVPVSGGRVGNLRGARLAPADAPSAKESLETFGMPVQYHEYEAGHGLDLAMTGDFTRWLGAQLDHSGAPHV